MLTSIIVRDRAANVGLASSEEVATELEACKRQITNDDQLGPEALAFPSLRGGGLALWATRISGERRAWGAKP